MLTLIILAVVIIGIVIGLSILLNKLAKNSSGTYNTNSNQIDDNEEVDTMLSQSNSNNQRGNIRNRVSDNSSERIATTSISEIDRKYNLYKTKKLKES